MKHIIVLCVVSLLSLLTACGSENTVVENVAIETVATDNVAIDNVTIDKTVEVVLAKHLPDEPRGWCIDAAGRPDDAIMEGGVHGHTCYSYENNGISIDQGFSQTDIKDKEIFRLVKFDHCMTLMIRQPDSWIALKPCDGREEQGFTMQADGQIISKVAPELCVTLGPDAVTGGPTHLVRTTILDRCDQQRGAYQQWRLRDHNDG